MWIITDYTDYTLNTKSKNSVCNFACFESKTSAKWREIGSFTIVQCKLSIELNCQAKMFFQVHSSHSQTTWYHQRSIKTLSVFKKIATTLFPGGSSQTTTTQILWNTWSCQATSTCELGCEWLGKSNCDINKTSFLYQLKIIPIKLAWQSSWHACEFCRNQAGVHVHAYVALNYQTVAHKKRKLTFHKHF